MPRFLIVAATPFEIKGLATHFGMTLPASDGMISATSGALELSILITGVGMVNTAYAMGRCPGDFDLVINAGVCGAFNRSIALGDTVHVVRDTLSEMGAEDGENFIGYESMGLGGTHVYREKITMYLPQLSALKAVTGITINKVHGHEPSIATAAARFNPHIESMEGAAFFRGCAHMQGTYIQLRTVSNYVEKRDKSKWNMPLAIGNLNTFLIELINTLHL